MRVVRRTLAYLRQHDWAAVLIEIAVVVIGVFIGIQAANWNQARGEARRAAVFSERLREDLREEAWGYEMQVAYYGQVAANARRAADGIAGRVAMSDEALLVAAYRATQYNSNIRRRATYDELTSTGEIGLIRESALRDLAMRVYTSPMFQEIDQEGRNSRFRLWFRQHIDHGLQRQLSVDCGDREVQVGRYEGIPDSLDYACDPGIDPAQVSVAVASLRGDPAALQRLRLRLADVETALSNLRVFNRTLRTGLASLARPTR
jgi:hypothetical protein